MAETNILNILNELIETCKDGETGYAHAAGVVDDQELKSYFLDQSQERGCFVLELKAEAQRLGSDPQASGSVAGAMHRMWFEAKTDMGLGDQAVLNSVEQGEDSAKKSYETALESALPQDILGIITRQAQRVFIAHDTIRDWRDRRKAA